MIKEKLFENSQWTRTPIHDCDPRRWPNKSTNSFPPSGVDGKYDALRGCTENVTTSMHNFRNIQFRNIRCDLPIREYLQTNSKDVVVGVGSAALRSAGIPFSWNDGELTGNYNLHNNDTDWVVVTKHLEDKWKKEMTEAIERSIDIDMSSGNFDGRLKRFLLEWRTSQWSIPDYAQVNSCELPGAWREGINPSLDIHHLQIGNSKGFVTELLHMYSPFYLTQLGLPLLVIHQDGGILKQDLMYPFRPQPGTHEVKLSVPERFTETDRSMLMIPRFAHFITQTRVMTGHRAEVSEKTKTVLRDAIATHAKGLNKEKRASAGRRLMTCIHRGTKLEEVTRSHYSHRLNLFKSLRVEKTATEQITNFLDDLGWGEAVLGKTAKEFANQTIN